MELGLFNLFFFKKNLFFYALTNQLVVVEFISNYVTVACKSLEAPNFFQFLKYDFSQNFSNQLKFLPSVVYINSIPNTNHKNYKL